MGYLDAGVNRFVLGPATDRRSPSTIAFLAAVRVGALAAFLLGPAAAIGVNGRIPGLVTGPRDAAVIAIYLGLLFGLAVSLATFLASLAAASLATERLAGGARRLSRIAGASVMVCSLAYLTLWWRTATTSGFGFTTFTWTAAALSVACAISLLLGHVTATTAFAVAIARHGTAVTTPAATLKSRRGWLTTLGAAFVAFAGASGLLVITASRETPTTGRSPLTIVSSGMRVRLIAIDGIDPRVVDDLAAAGRLPSLSRLIDRARARLMRAEGDQPSDPARVWTTIATGTTPEVHGVSGLETRRVAGVQGTVAVSESSRLSRLIGGATDLVRLTRPSIASGSERRVKTLWEVAADAGLRTVVVNWWATWPASSSSDGIVIVSDRAVLRLDVGGAVDAEIAPVSIYERLRQQWPSIRSRATATARAASASLEWGSPETRTVLERSAELDAIQLELLRAVQTSTPDLSALYLPGLDIAQNALLGPREAALAPSEMTARVQALRDYVVYLDRLLADSVTTTDSEVVVLLTEPGRVAATAPGLLSITGSIAAPRADVQSREVDAAPTILHILGVPLSRELPGGFLASLFKPDFVQRYPIRHVATYGQPSGVATARSGQPLDQEMIDRLRSLGYVK